MYKLKYFIIFYVLSRSRKIRVIDKSKSFELILCNQLDPIIYQIQQTTTDYEWKQVFTIDRKSYFVPVKTASHNKKN